MSRARKHVAARALGKCPELEPNERIMRVVAPRGSNLIEVEDPSGKSTLCLLPAKFQRMLWVRRGSFVVVDETDREQAEESGGKVTGTISSVLFPDHVRELKKQGVWPGAFDGSEAEDTSVVAEDLEAERATDAMGQAGSETAAEGTSLRGRDALDAQKESENLAESYSGSEGSDDEGQLPLARNPNHGNRPGDNWDSSSDDSDDDDGNKSQVVPKTFLRTSRGRR